MTARWLWVTALLGASCGSPASSRQASAYACTVPAGHEVTLAGPRAAALDGVLRRAGRTFPGVVAYAETPDGVWFGATGFADLDARAPMQACTLSRVGSVSKTFVALAALRLVDRGLLDLDAPAATLVPPGVTRGLANADRATVRQLLNHTSGIPHGLDQTGLALSYLFNDPLRPRSSLDFLNGVRGGPPAFPVGQGWGYSNSNYNLLGVVLEAVSGQSLPELLQAEVWGPHALASSSYLERPALGPAVARGYLDCHGDGSLIDSTDFSMGQRTPAGGVVSNVFDVAALVKAAAAEPRMQAWVDVPVERAVAPNHTGYGLGLMRWHTVHGDALGHGGELFGWQAWAFTFEPQHVTWVMLVNADFGSPSAEFHRLQDEAVAALFE